MPRDHQNNSDPRSGAPYPLPGPDHDRAAAGLPARNSTMVSRIHTPDGQWSHCTFAIVGFRIQDRHHALLNGIFDHPPHVLLKCLRAHCIIGAQGDEHNTGSVDAEFARQGRFVLFTLFTISPKRSHHGRRRKSIPRCQTQTLKRALKMINHRLELGIWPQGIIPLPLVKIPQVPGGLAFAVAYFGKSVCAVAHLQAAVKGRIVLIVNGKE